MFKKVTLKTSSVMRLVRARRWDGDEEDRVPGVKESDGQGWQKIRLDAIRGQIIKASCAILRRLGFIQMVMEHL